MNHTTRRYPRTLSEAYGPYCSHYIEDNEVKYWTPTRIMFAVTYFLAFVTLYMVL
jgi:hypothetical protein